jgi:hypothetical protein
VTFSAEPAVVGYYEQQMQNLEFDPQEIEEFRAWLLALGGIWGLAMDGHNF